ncbi:hypothetical protein RCF73_09605 [Staphylococcus chromogenes]|uniref:hypothetical protein n=1 Tax=Staphylococcus chromogenes TaxID=46126 RepID=UPI003AFFE451
MEEQNKKPQRKENYIEVSGWEFADINRKLNFFNYLLIILIVLEVFQIILL